MIRLAIQVKIGAYLYQGHYIGETKVVKLIKVQANQMVMEERKLARGVKKDFLESHLEALVQQGKCYLFNRTLALIIYGLVLFGFTLNIVDQVAMDVFFWFNTYGVNPVPANLAHTFLSIEVYH